MRVVTRFAPSPTGLLHIGSARTALFNWLFARHHGGKYFLRIEDTDKVRSTEQALSAILEGLSWLGIKHDGEAIYQLSRSQRHQQVAHQLVKEGKAYYCYNPPQTEESKRPTSLDSLKEGSVLFGSSGISSGNIDTRKWRNRPISEAPGDIAPTVRLKVPLEGERVVHDMLRSDITIKYSQMDDMVLLRSDGTPTYMLAVVVDDHDMGITHIIRGDDHLTNAFRQVMLYDAMGWDIPQFAHIPLIHGPDGTKLSKRHGATGVEAYKEAGYLPQALCNYLLRLGWSHGNEEIISFENAIKWFDMNRVGTSPSRFDKAKLDTVNHHYIQIEPEEKLVEQLRPIIEKNYKIALQEKDLISLRHCISLLKSRAKTLQELCEASAFSILSVSLLPKNISTLLTEEEKARLNHFVPLLTHCVWEEEELNDVIKTYLTEHGLAMPLLGKPLRLLLTGTPQAPSFVKLMVCLGKEETLRRLSFL